MTDKFNLSKNLRTSIISFIINIALVFISYRLVIVFDGLESLGIWSLLMAWAALVRLGDVGMGGAILRFVSPKDIETDVRGIRSCVDTGLMMNMAVFILLTISGYALINWQLTAIVDSEALEKAKSLLPLMLVGIFFASMTSVMVASLQGVHLGYLGSYITVVGNLIQIICVLILVPKIGVLGLAWGQLIQYVVLTCVGWYLVANNTKSAGMLPANFSFKTLRQMFSFSLKAQIANVTNSLFEPVSKILLSQYGGLQAQGAYELAYKTVSLSRNAIVTGLFASLPALTSMLSENRDKAKEFYIKSKNNTTKAIAIVLVLVVFASPIVSWLWVGDFNRQYVYFVVMLAIGFIVNAQGATAYNLGLATGVMKYNIFSSFIMLITLVVSSFLVSSLFLVNGVPFSVGVALAVGGVLIKLLNERLLFGSNSNEL